MPDREKVIKGLEHCVNIDDCRGCVYFEEYSKIIHCGCSRDALELLKEQRKKGHWIEKGDYDMDVYYDCSVCGESWTTIEGTPWENGMNYCPHCGADMR